MKRSNSPREEEKDTPLRQWSAGLRLSAAGITLAVAVLMGAGFGYWLDQRFKTQYWTPIWAVLGVVAGFRELFRAVNAANREEEERARRSRKREDRDGD